jgi:hypothetical protein
MRPQANTSLGGTNGGDMPSFLDPPLTFRPEGPFHGLVVVYLCAMQGFKEIASRGAQLQMSRLDPADMNQAIDRIDDERTRVALRNIVEGGLTGLLADSALHARAGERVKVDISQLSLDVFAEHRPAVNFLNQFGAGSLLITAAEMAKERRTKEPDWEFLRHCRNAAAHNGHFHFGPDEPRLPAVWRGLEIDRLLQGSPLFNSISDPGFLGPGDTLHLLSDLEAKYF